MAVNSDTLIVEQELILKGTCTTLVVPYRDNWPGTWTMAMLTVINGDVTDDLVPVK